MTSLTSRVPLLLGTAATVVLLAACGANEVGEPEGAGSETPLSPAITATPTSSATGSASPTPGLTNQPSASTSGGPSAGEASSGTGDELEVEDQRGDGRTVTIEEAVTPPGTGFVAVYRGDQLLGSVAIGPNPLTVQLDTPVPATGELQAVLFGEDGDGQFDAAKDPRLEDEDFDYSVE
ncbi:DUF7282 domain-containing protein [Friedmanniella luteola]|nr:hypothetical protein [Friedmanniella luteola]